MKKLLFFVLIASLALALAAPAFAVTLCVNTTGTPPCYETIQAAVDAANPGDIIQVQQGRYDETVEVYTNNVTIEGVNVTVSRVKGVGTTTLPAGAGVVVIDALGGCMEEKSIGTQQAGEAGIYIEANDVKIRNLTVRHSCAHNIFSYGNNTIVEGCRLIDGFGGLYIENHGLMPEQVLNPAATIQNCEIAFNGPGGAVWIHSDNPYVFNNRIYNNFNVGVLVEGYNAKVITNEIHAVGASVYDVMPQQGGPVPEEHGVCVAVMYAEGSEIRNNNISNCAVSGIEAITIDFLIQDNTIDAALIGILLEGEYGLVKNNIINGVLAGMVSFTMGGVSLEKAGAMSDNFVNSLLAGTLAQDLPTMSETVKQQAVPADNGIATTYSANQVRGAIVLGYMFMGYGQQILDNISYNVPSTLISDYMYDSMGDKCGFIMEGGYADIRGNYSANSSTGFYVDLWSNTQFVNNTAENNTLMGFTANELHYDTVFANNRASYNGGQEWWSGGFDIWNCSCFIGQISGNIAEFNGVGMWIGTENSQSTPYPQFTGNSVRFNRMDGAIFWGDGIIDVTNNEFKNNEGEGMANQGGNIGVLTGNSSQYNRDSFCNTCGGTMPDPTGFNTFKTWLPDECPLLDYIDACGL